MIQPSTIRSSMIPSLPIWSSTIQSSPIRPSTIQSSPNRPSTRNMHRVGNSVVRRERRSDGSAVYGTRGHRCPADCLCARERGSCLHLSAWTFRRGEFIRNVEPAFEEIWNIMRSPKSYGKESPRWNYLPPCLIFSISKGFGFFGVEKKWYTGDIPTHTRYWYENAPSSERLKTLQALGLSEKPLLAGDGVPLTWTASWAFLWFILFSGLFSWPEALSEAIDTVHRRYLLASCPGPVTPDLYAESSGIVNTWGCTLMHWAARISPRQILKRFFVYEAPWIEDLIGVSDGTVASARMTLIENFT